MLCGELGETFTITLCNFVKSGRLQLHLGPRAFPEGMSQSVPQ